MAYKRISPQPVDEGGTGATTLTDHGVLVGSGTSAITPLTVGTNGQVLIGSSAADPVFGTIISSDDLLNFNLGAGTLDIIAKEAVSAAANLTDNLVVRGDGGTTGVQTSTISVTDNGEMTNASQPAFLALLGSTVNNQTGDGTVYTIVFDTEIFDQNSDFNTGTGTFTAPVTGRYAFAAGVYALDQNSSNSAGNVRLVTSNRNALGMTGNAANWRSGTNDSTFLVSSLTDMDAADVANVTITIFASTLTVDIGGGATDPLTYFSGFLAC